MAMREKSGKSYVVQLGGEERDRLEALIGREGVPRNGC